MNKLLLLTGDLATGKSTFARILSRRNRIPVFCKDEVKEVLGDAIGFANREENKRLSAATMEMMLFIFREFARRGDDLILEANFHEQELERFHALAKEAGYDVLTLALRGDDEILHARYLHRMTCENRHPVHLSTTIDRWEDFKAFSSRARAERIPGRCLTLCANDFAYQTDEAILGEIDDFLLNK